MLTDRAIQGNAAAATHNQAMPALVFLDKRVLNQALEDRIHTVRAAKQVNVPVVMTRDAVTTVLALMEGTPPLGAPWLYGSGWRRMETVWLRVQALAWALQHRTVRSGKGEKERCTHLPATLLPFLQHHLVRGNTLPQQALAQGDGAVSLLQARERHYRQAATAWVWQHVHIAQSEARSTSQGGRARQCPGKGGSHLLSTPLERFLRFPASG